MSVEELHTDYRRLREDIGFLCSISAIEHNWECHDCGCPLAYLESDAAHLMAYCLTCHVKRFEKVVIARIPIHECADEIHQLAEEVRWDLAFGRYVRLFGQAWADAFFLSHRFQ